MAPKRKWTQAAQPQPAADPEAVSNKRGHRWTRPLRVIAVKALLAFMPVLLVTQTQMLPVDGPGENMMRNAYARAYEDVTDAMYKQLGAGVSHEQWETELKPSTKAVREMAQRYTLRFIVDGNVFDLPPHEPGYKDEDRKPFLERLVQLLRCGYVGADGQHHVYRNLEHAAALDPDIHQLCFAGLGLNTYRAVWKLLKKFCPALYCGLVKNKKVRNRAKTQVRNRVLSLMLVQLMTLIAVHAAVIGTLWEQCCAVFGCVQQSICTPCIVLETF